MKYLGRWASLVIDGTMKHLGTNVYDAPCTRHVRKGTIGLHVNLSAVPVCVSTAVDPQSPRASILEVSTFRNYPF